MFVFLFVELNAQLVEVRADYTGVGDVQFVAYNNTEAPLYLNIDFADLENTTFNEPLPYIKLLEPGFNNLFMLLRRLIVAKNATAHTAPRSFGRRRSSTRLYYCP